MCNVCDDVGCLMDYHHVVLKGGFSDYQWREKPCTCAAGKEWTEHDYNVKHNMASRINKFLDKYYGEVWSSYRSTNKASRKEMVIDYIENGKRNYYGEEVVNG